VTFFVRTTLATGPIRFGVSSRQTLESINADSIDGGPLWSTGPSGEFVPRHEGLFFADERSGSSTTTIRPRSGNTRLPFLSSIIDGTPRGYGFLGLMLFGAILILLGLGVIVRKGPQGWIEVGLGIVCIAIPPILTANRRRQIRQQEERERAEREATDARNRKTLASYLAALDRLHRDGDDSALDALRSERLALTLPYEVWSAAARRTTLQLGFEGLSDPGRAGAAKVSSFVSRVARAAGLEQADEAEVKRDLYRSVVWHLLADDCMGSKQSSALGEFRVCLEIGENDVLVESKATEELERLRGMTTSTLPRVHCPIELEFQEYCIHHARGLLLFFRKKKWIEAGGCDLIVTNRRLIVSAKKGVDVPLSKVLDIDVDLDENVIALRIADLAKPLYVRVDEPIFNAGLLDTATTIDERPKGFS
jgi:hypothetical protein